MTFPVQVLALILDLVALYYAVLFLASLTGKRQRIDYSSLDPRTRFAVLIPAHDEEKVIGDLLTDLSVQNYPAPLFDVYVVDDASIDNTARIVEDFTSKPNFHLVRRREQARGKPSALNFGLTHLRSYVAYDAVAVFDADNRVEKDWLRKVDCHHQCGSPLVQTNVRTKNPDQSLLTKLIYYEYLTFGRIWQLGKSRLQWCNAFAGTGMSVKWQLLEKFGFFDERALTEDLELTIRLFNANYRVTYVHDASVWDEKPATLGPFFRQRVRWATGHLQACRKLFGRGPLISRWEANFYLFAIVVPFAVMAAWLFSLLQFFNLVTYQPQTTFVWIFASFAFIFTTLIAALQEGDWGIIRYVIPLHIYLHHWIIVLLWSAIKSVLPGRSLGWAKTPHSYDGRMKNNLQA